ncbi:helix-turn-helix domain-containing protein [Phormidium tenue FACHB-886]|nr:helix-turn-helix domain-containing protein [Phormidium tenue FACHB-886]
MVSSILAQLRKDLWQQDQNGYGYYQHRAKGNPENYVEHYISTPGDIEILPWEQAEQIIDKFGFTTVKLHLLLAAHTMNQAEPWKSNFVIKGSSILKELGWDKRTDIPLHAKLNEIAKAAFVLDCLLVRTVWIEGRTKGGRVDASIPIGRMWTVVIEPHGQLDVNGQISEPEEVYLGIQPGLIFERFLNKAGSKLRQALYQFGYLAQEVLKIDPYHDELALRLAIHLTMDSRIHPSGRYQVATLLETILPTAVLSTARQDSRRAFDLKKRWDNALTLLTQLNWEVEFDEFYPEVIRPGSQQRNPKGYFEQLLAANIVIKPRSPIPQLIAKKTLSSPSKPAAPRLKPSATLTGAEIRQARQEKKWNQRELAGWMGVSQTLINHWEKEKRFPSPEQESRLRTVLKL